jgi:protein involved in polysaccharide export with SLBB domain
MAVLVGAAALAAAQPSRAKDDAPDVQQALADYRLGAGDKVRVITFGEEALTNEFYVSGSGKVSLPLVGEVQAAGLSLPEFQHKIEDALRGGYLKAPRVSVEVVNYRPFYILGEVNKPGEYPYTNRLTVLNAVATANGFTYRANTRKIFIRRAASNVEMAYPLTAITSVAPGDTIRIAERWY